MKPIRVGVIGLGMGRHHVAGYQTHPQAEVVAIADLDKKRLKEAAAKYGVPKVYSSGEEMLRQEQLDVVSVATPNKYHKPMKDVPRKGQIVLQDHPGEIHFRNIRIKPFD